MITTLTSSSLNPHITERNLPVCVNITILMISTCAFSLRTESVLMLFLYQLASRNKEIKKKQCVVHLKEYEEYAEIYVSEYC